jgi:hypothetical protein
MAYRLPTFNVTINLWRFGVAVADPPSNSPVTNFNVGRRIGGGDYFTDPPPRAWYATSWLLLPKNTVIVGDIAGRDQGDTAEIPAGSGTYYHVFWADRSALGFPNEHMAAIVAQVVSPVPHPPAGALLDEAGDAMLDEAGVALEEE